MVSADHGNTLTRGNTDMTQSTEVKVKRVTYDKVRDMFTSQTPFTAGNGTLVGVAGAVDNVGAMPRNFRTLYAHHKASGSYTVLFTVVSKGNVIGWVVNDSGRVRRVVMGNHGGSDYLS